MVLRALRDRLWKRADVSRPGGTVIVPRGKSPVYYSFVGMTAQANGMQLMIDRRVRERRVRVEATGVQQRIAERRAAPSASWTHDGVMVVPGDESGSAIAFGGDVSPVPRLRESPRRPT